MLIPLSWAMCSSPISIPVMPTKSAHFLVDIPFYTDVFPSSCFTSTTITWAWRVTRLRSDSGQSRLPQAISMTRHKLLVYMSSMQCMVCRELAKSMMAEFCARWGWWKTRAGIGDASATATVDAGNISERTDEGFWGAPVYMPPQYSVGSFDVWAGRLGIGTDY